MKALYRHVRLIHKGNYNACKVRAPKVRAPPVQGVKGGQRVKGGKRKAAAAGVRQVTAAAKETGGKRAGGDNGGGGGTERMIVGRVCLRVGLATLTRSVIHTNRHSAG